LRCVKKCFKLSSLYHDLRSNYIQPWHSLSFAWLSFWGWPARYNSCHVLSGQTPHNWSSSSGMLKLDFRSVEVIYYCTYWCNNSLQSWLFFFLVRRQTVGYFSIYACLLYFSVFWYPVCLCICLFFLSLCLFVYLSICLYACLPVCLSACLSVTSVLWWFKTFEEMDSAFSW
jgi:hypothetical protein